MRLHSWFQFSFLLLASAAFADSSTVAAHPVEYLRTPKSLSASAKEDLTADFTALLRKAGATVPNRGAMEAALTALNRQDCAQENSCLAQLADKAKTLYAVHLTLDFDVKKKQLVAQARIVRSDGTQVATTKTKAVAQGKRAFAAAAEEVFGLVIDGLGIKDLPATLPKAPEPAPVVVAPPPPRPVPEVKVALAEPAPPPATGLKTIGTIGTIGLAAGAAVAAAGAVVLTLSATSGRQLDMGQNIVPRAGESVTDAAKAYRNAENLRLPGIILAGAGVAVAATGAVLLMMAPKAPAAHIAIAPTPGGATVAFTGALP
jgi:hypothetical protein